MECQELINVCEAGSTPLCFTEKCNMFTVGEVISGNCSYAVGEDSYKAEQGDVFLLHGASERTLLKVGDDFRALCVRFEPRFFWLEKNEISVFPHLQTAFALTCGRDAVISSACSVSGEIKKLLQCIKKEYSEKAKDYIPIIQMNVLSSIILFSRECDVTGKNAEVTSHVQPISRSMNYICAHIDEPLSLEKIAEAAHMSRTYYCTAFKAVNGITPWEFVNIKRVEIAEDMLREGDELILNIAMKCGFNNSTNFNRIFKKITGVTPKEYRREFKNNERNGK